MTSRDLPHHDANETRAMETLHERFFDVVRDGVLTRAPGDIGSWLLMRRFSEEADEQERRLARDANRGVAHRKEMGHFRSIRDAVHVRVKCRPGQSKDRELWLDMMIADHMLEGLAERLHVNRIQTVEEYIARAVFDALVEFLNGRGEHNGVDRLVVRALRDLGV